eukprot:Opistho-1_new@10194
MCTRTLCIPLRTPTAFLHWATWTYAKSTRVSTTLTGDVSTRRLEARCISANSFSAQRQGVPTRHSKMDLIDIGANLAHRTFSHNLDALLASARAVGVRRIVATGTSLPNSRAVIALARRFPGTVFATCGVHPHDAKSLNAALLSELERVAQSPEVVAVG